MSSAPRLPGVRGLRAWTAVLAIALVTACGAPDPVSTPATAAAGGVGTTEDADRDEPAQPREVEASAAQRVGSVVPEDPLAVELPGTDWLDVITVGTRGNGLLDVPPDVRRIGWWDGGSRIGDPFGAVLLAGHVDSATQGLGPAAVLLTAERGDRVAVRTADRTVRYAVRSRRLVPLDDLAAYPRVLSARGPARLMLVTCAPPFLPAQGGYQNLAVVEARPLPPGTGGAAR